MLIPGVPLRSAPGCVLVAPLGRILFKLGASFLCSDYNVV